MAVSLVRLGDYGPLLLNPHGGFQAGAKLHAGALLVSRSGIYEWAATGAGLDEAGVLGFLGHEAQWRGDFLLFGTGLKQRLLPPGFMQEIERRGLGLEAMDTAAACRTYNFLLSENRLFSAALLPYNTSAGTF